LLERTPNISGGWVGVPGTIYFNFLHRFTSSGAPERQVTNYPTFLLGYAPLASTLLGVNYATRSDIAPRFPNEYEIFARYAVLPFLSLQAGYNNAAESVDGELGVAHTLGPLRVLAAGRAFSNGFASDTARFAIAGGATWKVSRWIALAADVATLLDARDDEDLAWAAALQLGIPYTPHTLSLQAANTNTATLQGQSRGRGDVRYGFEFTVPFTLSRFFGGAETAEVGESAEDGVGVALRAMKFDPATLRIRAGQAVVWRNHDQLAHTVTAADGSWTSPLIDPGKSYRHVFDRPGTYDIVCTPHPFMKAVVEVLP
jgi:plastocyanin